MRKLPEGEAKRRHEERNRVANEKRKALKIKTVTKLSDKRLADMREYARNYRALAKANKSEEKALFLKAKQERKDRMATEKAEAKAATKERYRLRLNERKRQKYAESKPSDWIDGRKLRVKKVKDKKSTVKSLKPKTLDTKKAIGKVLPTRQQDLSNKIPFVIPELRLTVYINPGQDTEAVRNKYLKKSL